MHCNDHACRLKGLKSFNREVMRQICRVARAVSYPSTSVVFEQGTNKIRLAASTSIATLTRIMLGDLAQNWFVVMKGAVDVVIKKTLA